MQTPVITTHSQADLQDILVPNERLLWSGQPTCGRRFFQVVGDERFLHFGLLIGALTMWTTLPLINSEAGYPPRAAIWVYTVTTLLFAVVSVFLAMQRQHVLGNLVYIVTNKRAIVCRRGKNGHLKTHVYVISCPHSKTYPYVVSPTRPYPSLQIGTLLSYDQVQPFGLGLAHPGQPFLTGRVAAPVMFEYMSNAQELLELIESCANDPRTG